MTTLQDLRPNDRARISGFAETGRAYRKKLLSMGLTPGAELTVKRIAPMGRPGGNHRARFFFIVAQSRSRCLLVEKLS